LDEIDLKSGSSVAVKPVITLDQVKQKAGEILEGKRQSQQSMDESHIDSLTNQYYTSTVSLESGDNVTSIDEKITLPEMLVSHSDSLSSTVEENNQQLPSEKCSTYGANDHCLSTTTWHATERTLSPMWETATSTSPEPLCLMRVLNESSGTGEFKALKR